MTAIDPTQVVPRLTRRRALAGAAWSAPTIVLATSVPAFAASTPTTPTLTIVPGTTAAVLADGDGGQYFDLLFAGLSVTVPGPALEAMQLMLTATFTPTGPDGTPVLTVYGQPDPWAITPVDGEATTVAMLFGSATEDEVAFPDGDFFGTAGLAEDQAGSFVLTVSAPGYASDTRTFATPPLPLDRGRRASYQRP